MTVMDSIVAKSEDGPELPRLTVSNTFITYQRIGVALESACTEYKALPDAKSQQDTTERLKQLIRACEGIMKHATRLLEANQ
jgi:hypothetical protein